MDECFIVQGTVLGIRCRLICRARVSNVRRTLFGSLTKSETFSYGLGGDAATARHPSAKSNAESRCTLFTLCQRALPRCKWYLYR